MPKFTRINCDTCIACGACGMSAPDVYDYDDEGLAYSTLDENKGQIPVPEELVDDVLDAFEGCPSGSVRVQDTPFND
ncbi:ferredoxin [Bacillus phage SP-15]|uniref:Ferredoxin n=1 Tax=Bacillus phage SP-15 TaxID=1792032 RepID=A0A127AYY7_9CAUD|nr:ferredoxin [Bacillus phage SP-15]AMM44981.1 ferredoxin [Bacillus phage SP-15]